MTSPRPPLPPDPCALGAARAAAALRRGELSSAQLVEACLKRIARHDLRLNAVVQVCAERARAEAAQRDAALSAGLPTGPLHGVPLTVKDSLDTEGVVTAAGTRGRASCVPAQDATAVARLRRAGAVLIGKTNTPELTIGVETDNPVYGRTSNPYDCSLTCGGSSGGSAVAVSSGFSYLDLGSDTAGSLRWPAHCCGVAAFKPTAGRIPRTGHALPPGLGAHDVLTQLGPVARRVEDLRLALDVLQGPDGCDPAVLPARALAARDPSCVQGLRVLAFADNGSGAVDVAVAAAVGRVVDQLQTLGARITWSCPADLQEAGRLSREIRAADGRDWLRRLLLVSGTVEPAAFTAASIERTRPRSGVEFARLLEQADAVRARMLSLMQAHDVIVSPVAGSPALAHGRWTAAMGSGLLDYTQGHNLLGWPAGCVNAGWSADGLPIGVQVASAPWRDELVLDVLEAIEAITGGWRAPSLPG